MILLFPIEEILKNTPLGGNIDVDKLVPCVFDAQMTDLEPLIGELLFNKIATDYENDTLSGLYLKLYTDYIKPYLIHASAKNYLLLGAYQINNGGITKHTSENSESVSKSEIDYLMKAQQSKAEVYGNRMKRWLLFNRIDEYFTYTQVVPVKSQSFGSWYLPDCTNLNTNDSGDLPR